MPFTASFSVSQSVDGKSITITDTSDYSTEAKNTFSNRQLFVYLADGSLLAPSDFSFADFPSDSKTIAVTKDLSLSISLQLTSNAPQPGSTYTKQEIATTVINSNLFLFSLCQAIAANPNVLQIADYYKNWQQAYVNKNAAVTAGSYSDQFSAQSALDRLDYMIKNKTIYFQ